jgi:hypothetical protein
MLGGFDYLSSCRRNPHPQHAGEEAEDQPKAYQIIPPAAWRTTWDPKPEAPIDIADRWVVKTKIPAWCSARPPRPQIADKITVVRSINGRIPDHAMATYHMFTGYLPTPALLHPAIGAVVSHELGQKNNLPAWVGVPNVPASVGTGYLSTKFGAFELGADPSQRNFQVRDIALPKGMTKSASPVGSARGSEVISGNPIPPLSPWGFLSTGALIQASRGAQRGLQL